MHGETVKFIFILLICDNKQIAVFLFSVFGRSFVLFNDQLF